MEHISPRRTRRGLVPSAAVAAAAMLALAGCTDKGAAVSAGDTPSAGAASATASPDAPAPRLVLPASPAAFDKRVRLHAANGTLTKVAVHAHRGKDPLAGTVGASGTWVSRALPTPGTAYDVDATVTTGSGDEKHLTGTITVAKVPDAERLTLSVQPNSGSTVGVGQPVVVRFDQPVSQDDRAGIERHATVLTDQPVTGSWHWISNQELHFRPKSYWPAHSHVRVRLDLNGVRASATRWGARTYTDDFAVGAKRVTTVNGATHTMTVKVDGKTVATWPTSLGKPEFATRTGTYVVLDKTPSIRMTSCSVHITCEKGAPNYYDLTVKWDVRLTWSGTFIHAAPWSAANQGVANVSHGCVNLTTARGEEFYNQSRLGDVVVVKNTGRTAADLVAKHDPGMADWNSSWSDYVAGSALGHAVKTGKLPAH